MKLGTETHKKLFCDSFLESHIKYEPEQLPWPELDDATLALLRGIPFWIKALDNEREAGAWVSAYAETVADPVLREALALQGKEELRHARLLQTLINSYGIEVPERPPVKFPSNIEQAFTTFGFEECLDSFFAFGIFQIAREAGYFPEQLFTIFDPIIDEEARHIVFFVNWFTYMQIDRSQGFVGLRAMKTLWYYAKALRNVLGVFGDADPNSEAFMAAGASSFTIDLTPEKFFAACLQENERRMSKFDSQLLRPQLLPTLAQIALSCLKLIPKNQPRSLETGDLLGKQQGSI